MLARLLARHTSRRRTAVLCVAALSLSGQLPTSGVNASPSAHAAPPFTSPAVHTDRSVPARPLAPRPSAPDPEAVPAQRDPAPVWPTPGRGSAALSTVAATPVTGASATLSGISGSPVSRADLEVLDQGRVRALGGVGYGFRVRRGDGGAGAGPVGVALDYRGFQHAGGGGFAGRLRLYRLPACATDRPTDPACAAAVPVAATNDVAHTRLTAQLDAVPADADPPVYLLATGTSGDAGDYRATDLSPAGKWSVGPGSGDFSYSLPIPLPPPPYGAAPTLSLSYSSQSVDGRTSATNNQASWVGLGWDLNPGYIERRYRGCSDDGVTNTGDLCWYSPYSNDDDGAAYEISLNGVSTEMIKGADGHFHLVDDEGWKVEHTFDGSNSDNTHEAWVISTPDGSRYYFGYTEDSNWTVPVLGNDAGEPCHDTYPASCRQAYRWQLNQIRDPNENDTRFTYTKESNYYRRFSSGNDLQYDRGGYLSRVEYGMQAGEQPMVRVDLAAVNRCQSGITDTSPTCAAPTTSSDSDYPDVPVDLICTSGQSCSKYSPSFFVTRRLSTITANVWNPTSSTYQPVTQLRTTYALPATSDNYDPSLWLDYAQEFDSWAEAVTKPAVNFDGTFLNNRVDYGSAKQKLAMKRISTIRNGLGGEIRANYGHGSTAATCPSDGDTSSWESGKHWDTNTQECFRVDFKPEGSTSTTHGVFHKYVVKQVDQVDMVGGSPTQTSRYEYLANPAWHYDDDLVTPAGQQEWGDWRGYQKVRTTTGGGPNAERTVTDNGYYRGMDGDKLSGGGSRSATVTDWAGNVVNDNHAKAGYPLDTQRYRLGDDGSRTELSATRYTYWDSGITANGPGLHNAHMIRQESQYDRDLKADGGWRQTVTTRDGYTITNGGLSTRMVDLGDTSNAGDDICTELRYAQNTTDWRWMLDYQESSEEHSGGPDAQSGECPGPIVARTVTLYDGATATGSVDQPIDGNPTELRTYTADTVYSAERKTYDGYGRMLTDTDPLNHTSTTSYNPSGGWPVNGIVTTNALNQSTTTIVSRGLGKAVRVTDPNGKVISTDYDGAGRLRRVWLATEPKPNGVEVPPPLGAIPSYQFDYLMTFTGTGQPSKPTVVTSRTLQSVGATTTWLTSYVYLDGFSRTREVQAPSATGSGRAVTVTTYDDRGLQRGTSGPIFNSTAPAANPDLMLNPSRDSIPSWTETSYDSLQRETASVLYGNGQLRSQTTTTNYGDGKVVTPPRGGRTASWIDGHDLLASVQQDLPAGSDVPPPGVPTTRYTYTTHGDLSTITDASGDLTRYGYDWAGHRISTDDPDAGHSTSGYDGGGLLRWTIDATGAKTSFTYDNLNRRRVEYAGDVGGSKLAEWTYDTVVGAVGKPVAEIRYDNSKTYSHQVTKYDARYRPVEQTWTIPAGEGGLTGTYTYAYGYDRADHQTSITYPQAGGLPTETVTTGYQATGQPSTLTGDGGQVYVASTAYSPGGDPQVRDYSGSGDMQRRYTYEPDGEQRLSTVETRVKGNPVQLDAYHYDAAGNLSSLIDETITSGGVGTPQSQCFTYDSLQRLRTAWTTTASCASGQSAADANGPDPYNLSYQYDQLDNITSVTDGTSTRGYIYPAAGPGAVRPHAVSAVGADTYQYDADGRLAARTVAGVSSTLTWNAGGDLGSVSAGAATTSFLYAADGSRLIRRDPDATTLYLDGTELRLAGGTVTATRYYDSASSTVALRTPTRLQWMAADQAGSAQLTMDAGGTAVARQRYLPYGAHRGADVITSTDRGFLGHPEDSSTGLDQVGARYYDASLGRFISPDPVVTTDQPQSLDPYSYAVDNPTTFSDPTGLRVCDGNTGDFGCAPHQRPDGGYTSHRGGTPPSGNNDWLAAPVFPRINPGLLRRMVKAYRDKGYTGSDAFTRGDLLTWAAQGNEGAWQQFCQGVLGAPSKICGLNPFTGTDNNADPAGQMFKWAGKEIYRHVGISVNGCAVVCLSLTFQDGQLWVAWGSAGKVKPWQTAASVSVSAQVTSTKPSDGSNNYYQRCAGARVVGCSMHGRADSTGKSWSGYSVGYGYAWALSKGPSGKNVITRWIFGGEYGEMHSKCLTNCP